MRILLLVGSAVLALSIVVNLVQAHRLREVGLSRVRRRQVEAAYRRRDKFADALVEIEAAAALWRDVDSPLAATVRDVLSRTPSRDYERGSA